VNGERTAFMRRTSSGSIVMSIFGATRAVDPVELSRQHDFSGATVIVHDIKSSQLNYSLIRDHVRAVVKLRFVPTALLKVEEVHTVFFIDFRKFLVHVPTAMTAKKPQPTPTGRPMSSELAELHVRIDISKDVDCD
jgi:hypothetical protein